ncbi:MULTISPECIES: hypothetical protein [unclassified Streptomyces]|uniref:hypothetical protein n=1 Tax=Streptomyces sp. T21Q-yed TaxID=3018441 RepID=UPI002366A927|nr:MULTISPECIES: hypothetical protein [unclassified Streptomyces]MDF3140976.1 hypothetical protein [Streptomyces sp. T21Q-yed]WDF44943.1 hypothetical protein PBV52_46055 [Streptomyces sp. T12]
MYEMRSLRTDAARAEAAALVQDRQRWLTLRGLPVPARADVPTRLITLWASDFAARLDLPHVRAEALARHPLDADPIARFLNRLTDMGWDLHGTGTGQTGERVARLELAAEHRPGLGALVDCRVHEPRSAMDERSVA